MALMDMSIISTALFTISVDFKNYRLTIWAALAYILADIGCAVFFTRLADVFGRKQILLTSFFFFTVFSLACGFSQTVEQLIIFRTLQGKCQLLGDLIPLLCCFRGTVLRSKS
jgi:MFS family permease